MSDPLIVLAPPPNLVDALGAPLREQPSHTFSNGPAWPEVTLESVARAAYETGAFVFRARSRHWFQGAVWRRWQELSREQQEQALATFRKPPPILDKVDPFMPSYSLRYGAMQVRSAAVRPVYVLDGKPETHDPTPQQRRRGPRMGQTQDRRALLDR